MLEREMKKGRFVETGNEGRKSWKRGMALGLAGLLLLLSVLGGCSAGEEQAADRGMSQEKKEESASYDTTTTEDSAASSPSDNAAETENAVAVASKSQFASKSNSPSSVSTNSFESMARKIIYHANLLIRTKEYTKARQEVENLIFTSNAYIVQMNERQSDDYSEMEMTVKVPQNGFAGFIQELEKVSPGKVTKSMKGTDVTEEYVDLESRLKAKQVVEARLLDFMSNATETEDLLRISNDLSIIQEEIETAKGRMRYLDNNVAFSTVEIRLVEEVTPKQKVVEDTEVGTLAKAGAALLQSLTGIYTFLSGLFIVMAGLLPVLLFLSIFAIPLWFFYRSRREKIRQLSEQLARENQAHIHKDTHS
jgi:Na+-transporting methylmalonyl-CoA/oxaloacetate decarboxylase gamma subunit